MVPHRPPKTTPAARAMDARRNYPKGLISGLLLNYQARSRERIRSSPENPAISANLTAKKLEAFGFESISKTGHGPKIIGHVRLLAHRLKRQKLSTVELEHFRRLISDGKFYVAGVPGVKFLQANKKSQLTRANYDLVLYQEPGRRPFRIFVGAEKGGLGGKRLENMTITNFLEGKHPPIINPKTLELCLRRGQMFALYPHEIKEGGQVALPKGNQVAYEIVPWGTLLKQVAESGSRG